MTTTLHVTQLRLRSPSGLRYISDPQRLHAEVWRLADKPVDSPRDFLFRFDRQPTPRLVVTSRTPLLREHPRWDVVTAREVEVDFAPGQGLLLVGRINPTSERQGHARCVVRMTDDPMLQAVALAEWLTPRLQRGGMRLSPGSVSVAGAEFVPCGRGGWVMVDMSCHVTVEDSTRAAALIANGLGDARAFGAGLLVPRLCDAA